MSNFSSLRQKICVIIINNNSVTIKKLDPRLSLMVHVCNAFLDDYSNFQVNHEPLLLQKIVSRVERFFQGTYT